MRVSLLGKTQRGSQKARKPIVAGLRAGWKGIEWIWTGQVRIFNTVVISAMVKRRVKEAVKWGTILDSIRMAFEEVAFE